MNIFGLAIGYVLAYALIYGAAIVVELFRDRRNRRRRERMRRKGTLIEYGYGYGRNPMPNK